MLSVELLFWCLDLDYFSSFKNKNKLKKDLLKITDKCLKDVITKSKIQKYQ